MTAIPVMTQSLCLSGALWGIIACAYIPPDQVPTDFYDNNAFDQTFGGSCVVNPFGIIVAGPETFKETVLYADVDLKMNAAAKSIINLTGIYSRWDILRLAVNDGDYSPLQPMGSPEAKFSAHADEVKELRTRIKALEARLEAVERYGPHGDAQ